MSKTDTMRSILERQKEIMKSLESEVNKIDGTDLSVENERLNSELQKANERLSTVTEASDKNKEELEKVKNAYTAYLLQDKLTILNTVNKRIERYFLSKDGTAQNRLLNFEALSRQKIDSIYDKLAASSFQKESEVNQALNDIASLVDVKIAELKKLEDEAKAEIQKECQSGINGLASEGITDEELKKSFSKKSFESFVGLNLFNKIGIFLLIIGTIAAGKFTFTKIGDGMKALIIFIAGAALAGVGEIMALKKHKANVFSQGLMSGGVAILYVGTVVSYFALHLISSQAVFILCAVITAIAFLLSWLNKSQTISAFAIIGGYLPMLSLFMSDMDSLLSDKSFLPVIVIYLSILCVFTFITSIKNKWIISLFAGFSLNTAAISGIAFMSGYITKTGGNKAFGLLPIAYTVFSMIVYLLDIFIGSKKKNKLSSSEFSLALINAVVSGVTLFVLVGSFFPKQLFIVPIALTVIFGLIKWFSSVYLYEDKPTNAIFMCLSLILSFAIVPVTWGIEPTALAWISESAAIIIFALYKDDKIIKISGFSAMLVSGIMFFTTDIMSGTEYTFTDLSKTLPTAMISYPVFIALSIAIIIISIGRDKNEESLYKIFTGFSIFNTIGFFAYITKNLSGRILTYTINQKILNSNRIDTFQIDNDFAMIMLFCIAVCAMVGGLYFWEDIKNRMTIIISAIITVFATGTLFSNLIRNSYNLGAHTIDSEISCSPKNIFAVNIAIMIFAALIATAAIILVLKDVIDEFGAPQQLLPIISSIAFVALLTVILTAQFSLRITNPIISIIYVITAALWIIFGFIKRYGALRKSGLVLTFVALAKLFLVDLYGLSLISRIISFFAFGIILIAVSFIYQYFNKRLAAQISKDDEVLENVNS